MPAGNHILTDIKLSHKDEERLQAYLDHLNIKLPTLLRFLLKRELEDNTYMYSER